MTDVIGDGQVRVTWASSLANPAAPTAAELTASMELTPRMTPDGLKADPTTAAVDTGSLASTTDTEEVGRTKYAVECTFKRGTTGGEDLPYTTLLKGLHGYLVVRRAVSVGTAWTAGQQVEVYPVACAERMNVATAPNEVMKYTVPMMVTQAPSTNATVA